MPLRIAAIEFLNAAPLMWGLDGDARFTLTHTLPAACADALRTGAADLGVIPVIELARIPQLVGLSEHGVAAAADAGQAEVRSILLISRCPAPRIRTLVLDPASRTSSALVQILLRHHFGAAFSLQPAPLGQRLDWSGALQTADAVLLIGDPALQLNVAGTAAHLHCYDLAREWRAWSGLPFVFALWGIRAEAYRAHAAWLPRRLRQSLREGLEHIEDLVGIWAPRLGIVPAEVRRYLDGNVAYRLTPAHRQGLGRFFALAARDGLLDTAEMPQLVGAEAMGA